MSNKAILDGVCLIQIINIIVLGIQHTPISDGLHAIMLLSLLTGCVLRTTLK